MTVRVVTHSKLPRVALGQGCVWGSPSLQRVSRGSDGGGVTTQKERGTRDLPGEQGPGGAPVSGGAAQCSSGSGCTASRAAAALGLVCQLGAVERVSVG